MSEETKENESLDKSAEEEKDESSKTINYEEVIEADSDKIDEVVLSAGIRLTPTGKISRAKTRVYTQRYRKEWEHMTDFKGTKFKILKHFFNSWQHLSHCIDYYFHTDWLQSVPKEATRAYCKFCQRNLHAHRLSLLKHMCTLKHQRAAVQYTKVSIFYFISKL